MNNRSKTSDIVRKNALAFRVSRKIKIDHSSGPGGRTVSDELIRNIVKRYATFTMCYGCYVYFVRAGKGSIPIYVGSTTERTLGSEAFTHTNLHHHCLQYLARYKKATLFITFIVPKDKADQNAKTRRGKCPKKTILKLEKVLTALAFRKNRNLLNKQNRGLQEFFIPGAINTNAGRPTTAVAEFKDMMGFGNKSVVVVKTIVTKTDRDV